MACGSGSTTSATNSKQILRKTPVSSKKADAAVSKNAKQEKVCKCLECEKTIEKQTHALLCEKCGSKWRCTDCLGLSDVVYAELIENSCLHWFCPSCEEMIFQPDMKSDSTLTTMLDKLMDQMIKLDQKLENKADAVTVEKLEERLDGILDVTQQRVETKVDTIVQTLNQNVTTVQECVEGALKQQLTEEKLEEDDKNRRKTSVIIHGVKQAEATDSEERIKEDEDAMQQVLHQIECDDVSVSQIIRLGRRPDGPDTKPRPIKMVLSSEEAKVKVLVNAKKNEEQEGRRIESRFHSPRPDAKGETSREDISSEAQGPESKGRERSHHSEWEDCCEEAQPKSINGQK